MSAPDAGSVGLHLPSLATGLVLMFAGTAYPLLFAQADGHASHGLALMWLWAMVAGLVRGVGFQPQARIARALLSGAASAVALALALVWRLA